MLRRRGLAAGFFTVLALAVLATPVRAVTPDLTFGVNYEQGPYLGVSDVGLGEIYILTEAAGPSGRLSLRIPYTRIDRTGLVTYAADGPIILGAGGPGKPAWQESEADTSEGDLGDLLLRYEMPLLKAGGGNKPSLTFALQGEYAASSFLCGDFAAAEARFDETLAHARSALREVDVHVVRIQLYAAASRFIDAVRVGRAALSALGAPVPETEEECQAASDAEITSTTESPLKAILPVTARKSTTPSDQRSVR